MRRIVLWLSLLVSATVVLAQGRVTDYAPQTNVECPDQPLLREFTPQTQTLHPQESAYISARESTVVPAAWAEWLGDGSAIGYNLTSFTGHYPRVGIAISGGGLRGAQYGAGVLSGLDARNESAKAAGTGGLMQVSSYMSGLSAGSWLQGSLYMNDWPTIPDLVFGNGDNLSGWLIDLGFVLPDGINIFSADNQAFFGSIIWSIEAKANKSVDTSITDPWSRMISYHFLNQTTRNNFFTNDTAHGAGQLWSQVVETSLYQQFAVPFPIIYADSRPVGSNDTGVLGLDSTVYEFTPLEFGSWDPLLSAMANMTYAGTHLANGQPPNNTGCVTGFDEIGFLMGTSSSLFNQILDSATTSLTSSDSSALSYILAWQLREVRTRANDVANWPNPFNGVKSSTFQDSNSTWLELIDGFSNQENIPLNPLFVHARGLDVVVAIDSGGDDADAWPNGTSFLFTSQRLSTVLESTHQAFPPIPSSPEAFLSTGVNMRPTFFGCDPKRNPPEFPLVISLPNSPPIDGSNPVTNTITFKLSYTLLHTRLFLEQAHNSTINGFTPNANTPDHNWGICLQCAAVDRARYKITPMPSRSAICTQCFQQYCFDPKNPPSVSELPGRKLRFVDPQPEGLDQLANFFDYSKFKLVGGLIGLIAFIVILIFGLLWWKKRKEKRMEYDRVADFHDDDLSWTRYSDHAGSMSYELPEHRGSLSS